MSFRLPCPASEILPVKVEDSDPRAEKNYQAHYCHDRDYCPCRSHPGIEELAYAISPEILRNGDGNKYMPGSWFITVNSICSYDGWNGSTDNSNWRIAKNDN